MFNPAGRLLRAGTRNRGVWEVAVDGAVSTVPLHRYWNASIGDHFYTPNFAELGGGGHGYRYEGVQCHVYTAQQSGTVPLHADFESAARPHRRAEEALRPDPAFSEVAHLPGGRAACPGRPPGAPAGRGRPSRPGRC